MKVYAVLIIVLLCAAFICGAFFVPSLLSSFGGALRSVVLFPEMDLSAQPANAESLIGKGVKHAEEEGQGRISVGGLKGETLLAEGEIAGSIFAGSGHFEAVLSEGFDTSVIRRVEEKVGEKGFDYTRFGEKGAMRPLSEPLTEEELVFVMCEICAAYAASSLVTVKPVKISFDACEGSLAGSATFEVCFKALVEKYHLQAIPNAASFSVTVPAITENSEISVISEEITLRCESIPIPDSVLLFCFDMVFGKKDHREVFASALENLFVNAGIYR